MHRKCVKACNQALISLGISFRDSCGKHLLYRWVQRSHPTAKVGSHRDSMVNISFVFVYSFAQNLGDWTKYDPFWAKFVFLVTYFFMLCWLSFARLNVTAEATLAVYWFMTGMEIIDNNDGLIIGVFQVKKKFRLDLLPIDADSIIMRGSLDIARRYCVWITLSWIGRIAGASLLDQHWFQIHTAYANLYILMWTLWCHWWHWISILKL